MPTGLRAILYTRTESAFFSRKSNLQRLGRGSCTVVESIKRQQLKFHYVEHQLLFLLSVFSQCKRDYKYTSKCSPNYAGWETLEPSAILGCHELFREAVSVSGLVSDLNRINPQVALMLKDDVGRLARSLWWLVVEETGARDSAMPSKTHPLTRFHLNHHLSSHQLCSQ